MTAEERLAMLLNDLNKEGVVLENKYDKWYWKALAGILTVISFGKIDFMHGTTTTIGNRIGLPGDWITWQPAQKYEALLHESKHFSQYKKFGFGNAWVGIFPVGFAYLFLPFPVGIAYCRAIIEREAYAESLRAIIQLDGADEARMTKSFFVSQYTSANYLWMWPFKSQVEKWFDDDVVRIIAEETA